MKTFTFVAREWAGVKEELANLRRDNPGLVFDRENRLINMARWKAEEAAQAAYDAAKPPQGEITGWLSGDPSRPGLPIREINDWDAIELAGKASNAVFRQFQTETGIDVRHLIHVYNDGWMD